MSLITMKYVPLLTLSIEQLFYQNKISRNTIIQAGADFIIKPTVECTLMMSRLGLVFKESPINGGFIILANVSGKNSSGNDLLRIQPRKNDKLTFILFLSNPEVLNFNELPASVSDNNIYFFSNRVSDPAALRDELHLAQNAAGVDGISDRVKMEKADYRFKSPSVVTPGTSRVKHVLSGAELKPRQLVTDTGHTELSFDLSPLPSGKCSLFINNAVKDEFYYMNEATSRRIFGVIELSLSNLLIPNYRLIEPDHSILPDRPVYKITFVNRKTRWRYTVRVPANSPLYLEYMGLNPADKIDFINRLNIVSNDSGIAFALAGSADTVFIFESTSPQALHEKYFSSASSSNDMLSLTLKKYIGILAKETQVRSGLPFPATQNTDSSNFPVVISNVFITI